MLQTSKGEDAVLIREICFYGHNDLTLEVPINV